MPGPYDYELIKAYLRDPLLKLEEEVKRVPLDVDKPAMSKDDFLWRQMNKNNYLDYQAPAQKTSPLSTLPTQFPVGINPNKYNNNYSSVNNNDRNKREESRQLAEVEALNKVRGLGDNLSKGFSPLTDTISKSVKANKAMGPGLFGYPEIKTPGLNPLQVQNQADVEEVTAERPYKEPVGSMSSQNPPAPTTGRNDQEAIDAGERFLPTKLPVEIPLPPQPRYTSVLNEYSQNSPLLSDVHPDFKPPEKQDDFTTFLEELKRQQAANRQAAKSISKAEAVGGLFHDLGQVQGIMTTPQKTQFDSSFFDKQRGQLDKQESDLINRQQLIRQRLLDKDKQKAFDLKFRTDERKLAIALAKLDLESSKLNKDEYESQLRDYNSFVTKRLRAAVLDNDTFSALGRSVINMNGYEILTLLKDAGNIDYWRTQSENQKDKLKSDEAAAAAALAQKKAEAESRAAAAAARLRLQKEKDLAKRDAEAAEEIKKFREEFGL